MFETHHVQNIKFMKTIKIIFALFLFTGNCLSQTMHTEPTGKTNIIVIKSELSHDELYSKTGRQFVENGLTIALKDKDFGVIETERFNYGSFPVLPYKFHASIKEGEVRLYGKFYSSGLSYAVVKSNKKAWKLLTEMAQSIGTDIGYESDKSLVKD